MILIDRHKAAIRSFTSDQHQLFPASDHDHSLPALSSDSSLADSTGRARLDGEEPRGISWNLALGLLVVHPVGAAYHTLLGRSRCCRWFG